jgi:hypothetical protein
MYDAKVTSKDRMSIAVKIRALRLPALAACFASFLSAQFGTERVDDRDLGRPSQPPFITFLGIVTPGKMTTDPSLVPQGPVAEVLFEELRATTSPGGPAVRFSPRSRLHMISKGGLSKTYEKNTVGKRTPSIDMTARASSVRSRRFQTARRRDQNSGIAGPITNPEN